MERFAELSLVVLIAIAGLVAAIPLARLLAILDMDTRKAKLAIMPSSCSSEHK